MTAEQAWPPVHLPDESFDLYTFNHVSSSFFFLHSATAPNDLRKRVLRNQWLAFACYTNVKPDAPFINKLS
jgi:hypothetical protein